MEMLADLQTEVIRYATSDSSLIGDEAQLNSQRAVGTLEAMSALLYSLDFSDEAQDSTSGQLTPLTTA